jgi:hypothetical protein
LSEENVDLRIIGTLLQLEEEVRQAASASAIEFIAVNETWRIFPYRQAALWRLDAAGTPQLQLVSGLADVEEDSPFRQWINQALAHLHRPEANPNPDPNPNPNPKPRLIGIDDLPPHLHDGWRAWMPAAVLLQNLTTLVKSDAGGSVGNSVGNSIGGIWFALDHAPSEPELALIERLARLYGHGLWAWRAEVSLWRVLAGAIGRQRRNKRVWLGIAVLALLPMRLTALAPAEIIGKDAKLIGAPADGVLVKFSVAPNQVVRKGQPLFALDDTSARNRNEVAGKSRAVAEADYLRATQKSFSDGDSKADMASLKAKLEEKIAEAQYTRDLLDRIQVSAPDAGIAVFSDPNDWLGKPVQTGERIIQLADPSQVQIAINLAVDDALNLDTGAKVKLYLNVSPLDTLEATVTQASYEPGIVADGIVAYHLKADLQPGQPTPRIGLKGTAKIYGHWAPLIYLVLRKPLAVLRRTIGI